MPSKNYTLFFIMSVGFVLISIAFITILGQTSKSGNGDTVDIRAKAGVANAMKVTGTVASYNSSTNLLVVNNINFQNADASSKGMGTWMVTPPAKDFVPSSVIGRQVIISVDSATFNTGNKTLTALSIQ
jgi:hypothetical protein